MSRSSEDFLASLHGLVGEKIMQMLQSDDPRDVREAINQAMKFLKDNNITTSIDASPALANIERLLPSADELEKLMTMTPD